MNKILSLLFPPKIEHLSPHEDLPEVLGYHYRKSRRGVQAKPGQTVGVRIVHVIEHAPRPKPSFRRMNARP